MALCANLMILRPVEVLEHVVLWMSWFFPQYDTFHCCLLAVLCTGDIDVSIESFWSYMAMIICNWWDKRTDFYFLRLDCQHHSAEERDLNFLLRVISQVWRVSWDSPDLTRISFQIVCSTRSLKANRQFASCTNFYHHQPVVVNAKYTSLHRLVFVIVGFRAGKSIRVCICINRSMKPATTSENRTDREIEKKAVKLSGSEGRSVKI